MTSLITDTTLRSMHGPFAPVENVAVTDTSAETTAALTVGVTYSVVATEDCYLLLAATGGAVTSTTGMLLVAGERFFFSTDTASRHLHAIRSTTNGILSVVAHIQKHTQV